MKSNEEVDIAKQALAEKSFGDIITDGLYLFGKTYGTTIIYFIVLLVFSNFLIQILTSDLEWLIYTQGARVDSLYELMETDPDAVTDSDMVFIAQYLLLVLGTMCIQSMIGAFFTTLAMCSVASFLYKTYTKDENFKSKPFNTKIFIPLTIIGLFVPTGFWVLLFIPGIVVFIFYIFVIFTYNMEDVEHPLKEAKAIAKHSYFKIILVFLFPVIITFTINTFFYQPAMSIAMNISDYTLESWLDPGTRNYLMLFLYSVVLDLVGILLAPLFVSILTVLFASLKTRKDLGYERASMRTTPLESRESIHISNVESVEERMGKYCSFCGNRRDLAKLYCPNCGKLQQDLKDLSLGKSNPPITSSEQDGTTVPSEIENIQEEPVKKRYSNRFCPFCGNRRDSTKDFCPNCGEDLKNMN